MSTKEKVLEALEREKGNFVSGEALAGICNVSRNAIWKSITELKKKGYAISSVTNRGYCLAVDNDVISPEGITRYMKSAAKVIVLEEVDSTNSEAKRKLLFDPEDAHHGTIIVAKSQSAGKGHKGKFLSPKGGIYFSVVLDASDIAAQGKKVTLKVREIVKDVLEKTFDRSFLQKEDSTFFLKDEKICGILTEAIVDLETEHYSYYIVGIGIHTDALKQISKTFVEKNRVIATLAEQVITGV